MDSKLVIEDRGESITVEPWGRDSLRVRVLPKGSRQTSDWALDVPLEAEGEVRISGDVAVIRNGKISCRISNTYAQRRHMEFFRHEGDRKKRILSEHDYAVHAHDPGTRIFRPTGDGLFHAELHLASRDGERFYGMGLNATGRVNLKGSVIDLYQRHVKHVVPFVVSSAGYGFLWNNPSLGRVEFGTNRTRWVSRGCRQLDYFVTTGDSYADIMSNYADATGHAPEFPYWASGFWQCKLRYETQEEFLAAAREFKRRGLPLAVHVIDFCHWDVLGNWRLDPESWPDPEAMVREMDEMGVRIMISPWALVSPKSENFRHMMEHGMFITSVDGTKDSVRFGREDARQYDPTNPEAARYLWSKWKRNYFDLGIRTFWLDPADDFHEIADYDRMRYHIGPATEVHCYYPVAHQKNIYEGLIAAGEKEVVTINRSTWAGSQRYGAAPAHHDILSSFEHFEEYMKAYLNLGMSGIPWAATGIGGFVPREEGERFHELMIRWYQYGVFCPIFRTHGNRKNNEPWNIGGDSYRHIRAAMLLRERLRPYVMKQMKLASERGLPPMRPVFFDFEQGDPKTGEIEDQFLFGPDLLVAPVTRFGVRSRDVYLPAGAGWTDAWTGKKLTGGQTIEADAPIEHIPVYVRGDSPVLLELLGDLPEGARSGRAHSDGHTA